MPIAVERVDEQLKLREPPTQEEKVAAQVQQAMTVPTPEQNDQALAQLSSMMGSLRV